MQIFMCGIQTNKLFENATCAHMPYSQSPDFEVGRSYNNMFRNHIRDGVSRCQVPRKELLMDAEVDVGLVAMEAFLASLRKELASILCSVGVNDSMAVMQAAAARCWDWGRLVLHRPTEEDNRHQDIASSMLRLVSSVCPSCVFLTRR